MRNTWTTAVLAGCLVLVPARTFAQSASQRDAHDDQQSSAALHATQGTVKSIDDTTLVVSRPHERGDITFTLSAATHRAGNIVVGATVSVRYRDDGKCHIATAVALRR